MQLETIVFLLCLLCFSKINAQNATEIILFDLKPYKGGYEISNPRNITNHKGYDNQPFFHPRQPLIYYSSQNEDGKTDIRVYHYKNGKTTPLTQTTVNEYSPTVTPDRKFISCILQRENNVQDLVKYPIDGGEAEVLIHHLTVGYHAWADAHRVILFVLGQPNSLHLYDLQNKKDTVLAVRIGRSLHPIPQSNSLSFVQSLSDKEFAIRQLDYPSLKITTLAEPLPNQEKDMCWTPKGVILATHQDKIYYYDKLKKEWITLLFQGDPVVLKGASRLAVSPDAKKLAVVVAE